MSGTSPSLSVDLSAAECWSLLHRHSLGRLATAANGEADIFPVNYVVDDHALVLRTAPGHKLEQLLLAPEVAFETDGHDSERYWSVVVRGTARHTSKAEAADLPPVVSWFPTDTHDVVRIVPRSVVGRSIHRARFGGPSLFG
jgi:nitroimidazol reductase NimA-like FMN-containing flavoprotein (pyridoxamine 5'-phosphate oxidase superfamily)